MHFVHVIHYVPGQCPFEAPNDSSQQLKPKPEGLVPRLQAWEESQSSTEVRRSRSSADSSDMDNEQVRAAFPLLREQKSVVQLTRSGR